MDRSEQHVARARATRQGARVRGSMHRAGRSDREPRRYISKGRRSRAEALLALGRLDEAADDAASALAIAEQIQGPESIWRALATSTSVFAAQRLTEEAQAVARRALGAVEEIASNLKEPGAAEVLRSSRDVERLRTSAS